MSIKIKIEGAYKIFGSSSSLVKKALLLSKNGLSRQDIYIETGCLVAVKNVSLDIREGERLVLMGLSGSGKSSLVRCLNGLHSLSEGSLCIDGQEISTLKEKDLLTLRRKKFGMVFQNFGLLPHRTVEGNIAYGLELQKVGKLAIKERVKETVELVGLSGYERMYVGELSGGMQQRVGIARALAINPDILLMDEAFSALDPLLRVEMQKELLYLQTKLKKTLVFVTHDIEEAIRLGNRIAIMQEGVIVQVGTPKEILLWPANSFIKEFIGGIDPYDHISIKDILSLNSLSQNESLEVKSIDWNSSINEAIKLFLTEDILQLEEKSEVLGYLSRKNLGEILEKEKASAKTVSSLA